MGYIEKNPWDRELELQGSEQFGATLYALRWIPAL